MAEAQIQTPDEELPPEPVEVEIENDTPPAQKPKGDAQAPAPKTPLPRPQARIQHLTHERDQWQSQAERLQNELAEARRIAAENAAARDVAERTGMENMVARTKSEVAAAEAALLKAEESGDAAEKVAAQKRLARATAEEADADAWTAANPRPEPKQPRQEQPRQEQRQQQPEPAAISSPVCDFMAENPWFSAVQMGTDGRPIVDRSGNMVQNPAFDEDMHDAAMIEHKRVAREVRLGTLPQDFIESPEYFQRIAGKVQESFPDAFEGEESPEPAPRAKTPQMGTPRSPVSPPTRQVPGSPPARNSTKMKLSGEQAELVRSLVDNGTMRYPRTHTDPNKAGKKMSYDDAYVQYAREVKANPPQTQS